MSVYELAAACWRADEANIQELIAQDQVKADVNMLTTSPKKLVPFETECTCLHVACYSCSLVVVTKLVAAGADVNIHDNRGYTSLHYACRSDVDSVKKCSTLYR